MNILIRYTVRSLQTHRKRTILSAAGIVIAVAMITAVMMFGTSLLDYLQRNVFIMRDDNARLIALPVGAS